MANPLLNKNYLAEAAISPYRIVKPGTSDGNILQGAAATDFLMGVCESVGPALGERCDVVKSGIADVEFGGAVTRGAAVTSDANGKAVAAAPAAGSNVRIIGFAEVSAVAGDIGPILVAPGVMQG
ncbi:MAG: capsid cement protein [Azonexus sp.]